MKHILLLFLLLSVGVRVDAKFSQVIYISPTGQDVKKANGFYEFENDDMKVTYSFWGENGLMGFKIYNKTSKPIYIDWKKSSMIYNGQQNPYYTNKTTSNYTGYGSSYGFGWASFFGNNANGFAFGSSSMHSSETIVKQERITFIPPHSYVYNAFYNILAHISSFTIDKKENKPTTIDHCDVYVCVPHDQIAFRNFITYSATEDFATEKYVDNEFSVAKIITMQNKFFLTPHVDGTYENEWAKATRFYISDIKRSNIFE